MQIRRMRMSSLRLHLGLQGGGAHGAFTWGVLDRLLDEDDLHFGRISGTSAGALNGAALVTGLRQGGRQGAKENLARLWTRAAEVGMLGTALLIPARKPSFGIWDDLHPVLPPALANPLGIEPLRYVVQSVVDIPLLRRETDHPLHVNAVNVRTGAMRVFGPAELSVDAILASACAPQLFSAIDVDGDIYWDGSYGANPAIRPLHAGQRDADLLLIELTPPVRSDTPWSAKNVLNRINEIASLTGLVRELQGLHADQQASPGLRFHVVGLADREDNVALLDPSLKRGADHLLFETLRAAGHRTCDAWLQAHRSDIGRRSTVDIDARYLVPFDPYR